MTREEAFKKYKEWHDLGFGHSTMPSSEVLVIAMNALRPVSREQVEAAWRSHWDGFANDYADGYEVYDEWLCRKCGFEVETDKPETLPRFCPHCGAPMTDEAVDMVMERLEALYETE